MTLEELQKPGPMLCVEDVAAIMRCDSRTVRRWLNSGDLAHVRVSARIRLVTRAAMLAFVESRTIPGKKINVR